MQAPSRPHPTPSNSSPIHCPAPKYRVKRLKPGATLIVPGELITAERVDYLPSGLGAGMMVAYLPGPTLEGARPSRGVDDGGSERDVR